MATEAPQGKVCACFVPRCTQVSRAEPDMYLVLNKNWFTEYNSLEVDNTGEWLRPLKENVESQKRSEYEVQGTTTWDIEEEGR